MAQTRREPTPLHDEPSIIVDPTLYLPAPRYLLQTLCDMFVDLTYAVAIAALAGTTAFGVAHVVKARSLSDDPALDEIVVTRLTELPASEPGAASVYSPDPVVESLTEPTRPTSVALADLPTEPSAAPARVAPTEPTDAEEESLSAPPAARAASEWMVRVHVGRRLLGMQRYADAEQAFREALRMKANLPAAQFGLARVHLARGENAQARAIAQRLVAAMPQHAGSHVLMGDVLRAEGNWAGADAEYARADRLSKGGIKTDAMLPPNPF